MFSDSVFVNKSVIFCLAVFINQPKFCPSTTWNTSGITFTNRSFVGNWPYGLHIDINNTVYVVNQQFRLIQVWFEGNSTPTTINITSYSYPINVFATSADDIYTSFSYRVENYRLNSTSAIFTLNTDGECWDLFIDTNNSLYCSSPSYHRVIKRSLNSSDYQITTVAGTGCPGFFPETLYYPYGIFVHINFGLYVADSNNNRIQMFPFGQLNGTTVAGKGAPETFELRYPTDLILDADGNLFIVDNSNNRIVGSGVTGFRCIIGCFGGGYSAPDRLYYPRSINFDSNGNLFVMDTGNSRVQKFLLATNSCGECRLICLLNEDTIKFIIVICS